MNKNLYVSTVAFKGKSIAEIESLCLKNEWQLEFSSGLAISPNIKEIYLQSKVNRMPHNYFPAPNNPFVINLASENDGIRRRSIAHSIQGLEMAKSSNSPFYAAHAGFCIDPDPNELGKVLRVDLSYNKVNNKELFLDSIREILTVADKLDIDFLVENNVLAPFNYQYGKNPLLCCQYDEIKWLFDRIRNKRLGLLLDTAHLKVSCYTLKLDLKSQFKLLKPFIRGLHHSDNNGLIDSNMRLNEDYWFLEFKEDYLEYVQVLEVKDLNENEIRQQLQILS
jgi:sugar phosphate isomerase/epimerase